MSATETEEKKVAGRLCDTGETVTVTLRGGKIASVLPGIEAGATGGADVWLAPGFCDLHINGYAGHDFNLYGWAGEKAKTDGLEPLFARLAQAGTALLCPTILTNSPEAMCESLANLARTLDTNPKLAVRVPGLHLEGPYLASEDGPRGAHPQEWVCDPDWDDFQRYQEAAGGRIKLCTLAPERDGAIRFIEKLTAAGVVAALGHTGAEPETIQDAVKAGARLSTHLGNAAHAQIRRHPNYIWEQLACDRLFASVIFDGHHLPPSVMQAFVRTKGAERLILVSDAVSLGGLPPGPYADGRYEVLPSGKIVLHGTPYLAGAGHLLDVCLCNALRLTDLTFPQAIAAVTRNPARLLGLEAQKGQIAPGYDADLTLFRLSASEPGVEKPGTQRTRRGGVPPGVLPDANSGAANSLEVVAVYCAGEKLEI